MINVGIIGCGFVGGALKDWLEHNNPVAEIVIKTMMEEGVLPVKDPSMFIRLIDIPGELKDKFQFFTHASDQLDFITEITKDNDLKMKGYIKRLINEDRNS